MGPANVVRALAQCRSSTSHQSDGNLVHHRRERLRSRASRGAFWHWRNRLFMLLTGMALDATEFFRIRRTGSSSSGGQIEI